MTTDDHLESREPLELRIDAGSVELCVYEWPGKGDPVLLLHATGFHSRCWNEVVEQLPGQHVYAVDIHFHGRSSDAGAIVDWKLFSEDMCLLIEQLDLQNIVGVGHSMGGYLAAWAASVQPERFSELVLIDPVIMSPERYAELEQLTANLDVEDHPVAQRKNNWRDGDEMFQRFCDRPPFDSWNRNVLRDYCDYALLPPGEDGLRQLACNPINEATNYLNNKRNAAILDRLQRITTPVTLLRARGGEGPIVDFSTSPTWPELASVLPDCRDIYLPDLDHFIPMRDPELVASYIREALKR